MSLCMTYGTSNKGYIVILVKAVGDVNRVVVNLSC